MWVNLMYYQNTILTQYISETTYYHDVNNIWHCQMNEEKMEKKGKKLER
jgi:hypothetical protein